MYKYIVIIESLYHQKGYIEHIKIHQTQSEKNENLVS